MMRSCPVGTVNVYFVRAARNRIVELTCVNNIGSGYFVHSHYAAAFANTRFRRHIDKIGVFHALEVIFKKFNHFKNLFTRFDFRRTALKRRNGIFI